MKLSDKGSLSPEDIQAAARTRHRLRLLKEHANGKLLHWCLYTIGFSLLPFLFNWTILTFDGDPLTYPTLQNVFQVQSLMFAGLIVCGTILERLGSVDTRNKRHRSLRTFAIFLYSSAAMVLAIAYALCTRNSMSGGAYDHGLIISSMVLVGLVILVSAGVYWLMHYRHFSTQEAGIQ